MKIQDLQKLHSEGHDFRIYSKEERKYGGITYFKTMWVEWIETGRIEERYIKSLTTSYLDNEYSFELESV